MIFGGGDIEQRRTTVGLAFLVVGLILLMWAWGSWIYRTNAAKPPVAVERKAEKDPRQVQVVQVAPAMLVGGFLLFVVFLVGSYVFVRNSRRFRESLQRKSAATSDTRDVWAMHKLKDFDDSDG